MGTVKDNMTPSKKIKKSNDAKTDSGGDSIFQRLANKIKGKPKRKSFADTLADILESLYEDMVEENNLDTYKARLEKALSLLESFITIKESDLDQENDKCKANAMSIAYLNVMEMHIESSLEYIEPDIQIETYQISRMLWHIEQTIRYALKYSEQ